MKLSTLLSNLALLRFSQVAAAVNPLHLRGAPGQYPGFHGYMITKGHWSGTHNGVPLELNGTIQQVYAQIQQMDPTFTIPSNFSMIQPPNLLTRIQPPICCQPNGVGVPGQPWLPANVDGYNNVIKYLAGLGGSYSQAGRSCSTVYCSGGASVNLCNDNPNTIAEPNNVIANMAQDLVHACERPGQISDRRQTNWACGQEFDTGGFNVFIAYSGAC